jgi:hypothetical protein
MWLQMSMPMDVSIICYLHKMTCDVCFATTKNVGAKFFQKETWTNQNDGISTAALLGVIVL